MLMYTIRSNATDPVDGQWHARLKPLMIELGETFDALMPPADRLLYEKQGFFASGYQSVPNLSAERAAAGLLEDLDVQLTKLAGDIKASEPDEAIGEAYDSRIKELQHNIHMVLAAATRDAEGFRAANRAVYGMPDPTIFANACAWIRSEAVSISGCSPHLAEECRNVLQAVPDLGGNGQALFPEDVTFQAVRRLHAEPNGYFQQLFGNLPTGDPVYYSRDNGDDIIKACIANVGSDYDLQDAPGGLWAVLQSKRAVVRPSSFVLSRPAFLGIVAHEVGSHLLENANGASSRLLLMELGLDRYEAGNEGRAFLREQIMYDHMTDYVHQILWHPTKASWEYRVAIHMVISLATGLNGREYTFPELYALLVVLFRFWTLQRGNEIDEELIRDGAWHMTVRALKGTAGMGGAYHKDIVYLEGNIRCWQAASRRPELILYGDLGKFDIANPRHILLLERLGILPKENE